MPDDLKEKVALWSLPGLDHLELMSATFVEKTFPKHTHDGFGFGVIQQGALGFYYRGENVVAAPGEINLVNPDEVHTGHAASKIGWSYRMFYAGPCLLKDAARQVSGNPCGIPFFKTGVIVDQELARSFGLLHQAMESLETTQLENQSCFLEILVQLILRHADVKPLLKTAGNEPYAVQQTKDYIESNFHENLSLNTLSSIAGLSPYYFIRTFRKSVGLTPHAYHMQVRIQKAKQLLKKGHAIADVAFQTGFNDQSHLNKRFKGFLGFTPGQYSNCVQDAKGI